MFLSDGVVKESGRKIPRPSVLFRPTNIRILNLANWSLRTMSSVVTNSIASGTRPLSIDTVINLSQNFSGAYSSTNKGMDRGPGYLVKYESKSRGKSAAPMKNVITVGTKIPIVFRTELDSSFGDTSARSSLVSVNVSCLVQSPNCKLFIGKIRSLSMTYTYGAKKQ